MSAVFTVVAEVLLALLIVAVVSLVVWFVCVQRQHRRVRGALDSARRSDLLTGSRPPPERAGDDD